MSKIKQTAKLQTITKEDLQISLNETKLAIDKLPKIPKKYITITKVKIHITDNKFFDNEDIKKEFIKVDTIIKESNLLDMYGNEIFETIKLKGIDTNGKPIEILSYKKMTNEVKEKVVTKIYSKEFNILDLKLSDTEINKYFLENKTMQVKNLKTYTTRFDGWIPETEQLSDNKILLHLFIR